MRVSSFVRLAGAGVAAGGAGYIPFAASGVGAQTAGASGWYRVHVVTQDPGYYYEFKDDTVCTVILPHGHEPFYNCYYYY